MRGGKKWFAVESKTFEVSIEEVRGKIRGTIVERSRDGRKFKVEIRENGVGRYILCSIIVVESKRFCLVVPEGKGLLGGWVLFAEKLRDLGCFMASSWREMIEE
ncbi:hypothetical protein AAG906_027520 [Vitis piasezkii]